MRWPRLVKGDDASGAGFRLPQNQCDAKMSHIMKTATVRDLRYHFAEIEATLRRGEEIEIRKRKRVIGRLVPVRPKRTLYPDFQTLRQEIFGNKVSEMTGAESVAQERNRY